MKVSKNLTVAVYDSLDEVALPSSKPGVLSEIETLMGDKQAIQFEMDWKSWGALRRHVAHASKAGEKPRFLTKVVSFKGNGRDRLYQIAVRRNE